MTSPDTELPAELRLGRHQLMERRQILYDRLNFASWGAIAGGGFMAIFGAVWFFDDGLPLRAFAAILAASAMQFLLAYQVRNRHEIAAGSMVVGYVISLAWKWYVLGDFSGIVVSAGLLVLYIRGFLAAVDLTELDKVYGPEPTAD